MFLFSGTEKAVPFDRQIKLRTCPKADSTICFCMVALRTHGAAEVVAMFSEEDLLKVEYLLFTAGQEKSDHSREGFAP